ncbi:MAG: fibronectin type III domain-containing protein [Chloroflexota bacterium]
MIAILIVVLPAFPSAVLAQAMVDELIVYDDQLAENWQNWSWVNSVELSSTEVIHTGSRSIRVNYSGWGGLSFYKADIPLYGKTHLQFYVHGGSGTDKPMQLFVNFEDGREGPRSSFIARANQWQMVEIPLSEINPQNLKITRLNWQNASGNNNLVVYFDEIKFVADLSSDAPQISSGEYRSHSIRSGGSLLVVRAQVDDPQGSDTITHVSVQSDVGDWQPVQMLDDGLNNDGEKDDGVYGAVFPLPANLAGREIGLFILAVDQDGNIATRYLGVLSVLGGVGSTLPAGLPQKLGWGSNAWSENPADDWQKNTGLPWNYVYQYITWGWESWGGNFVRRFVEHSWRNGFIPVVTVYMMLGATGGNENAAVYAEKLKDSGIVSAYLQSLELAITEASGNQPVVFVIEPDFYGFMQQLSNSSSPPAGVRPDDPDSFYVGLNKTGYANNLSGFGQYLIDLIHSRAPNALAAPMVSMWGVNRDPLLATQSELTDYVGRTAGFMRKMGADRADLITVEWSDRDAGRGIRPWWDDHDTELPRPNRAILWGHLLGQQLNKRLLLWQVPVGNMDLNDTCQKYRDNRAAYLFRHPQDLWEAGYVGILFGGGDGCSTQVWTDGGFVESQASLYYQPPFAPLKLQVVAVNGAMVRLRWQENPEQDVTGYRLYYQPEGSGAFEWVDVSVRNSAWLILPTMGRWQIWAKAYDLNQDESPPSDLVFVETDQDAERLYLPVIHR